MLNDSQTVLPQSILKNREGLFSIGYSIDHERKQSGWRQQADCMAQRL